MCVFGDREGRGVDPGGGAGCRSCQNKVAADEQVALIHFSPFSGLHLTAHSDGILNPEEGVNSGFRSSPSTGSEGGAFFCEFQERWNRGVGRSS